MLEYKNKLLFLMAMLLLVSCSETATPVQPSVPKIEQGHLLPLIPLIPPVGRPQDVKEPQLKDINEKKDETPYMILSLDGGGIRGVMVANILADIEKVTGKKVFELFDVIAGTSTGGLIAILLTTPIEGNKQPLMTAAEVENFYINEAGKIFKKDYLALGGLNGPRYDAKTLEKVIEDLVDGRLFKESLKPLVITSFDIEKKQGFIFESDDALFNDLTKKEIARATSAAPTFFAPQIVDIKDKQGQGSNVHYMVDGGLYKNNPSLLAYLKLLKNKGRKAVSEKGVVLVSIGTGWPLLNAHDGENLLTAGFKTWAPAVVDAIIDGTTVSDHEYIKTLFQSKSERKDSAWKYVRIQPILDNASYPEITELDNVTSRNIKTLVSAAENTKKTSEYKEAIEVIKKYAKKLD